MKEEEIINNCKSFISVLKDMEMFYTYEQLDYDKKYEKEKQYKSIQGLLDLYKKEKEKNKELLEERKGYAEEYIHNNPWLYKQLNELYVFKTDVEKDYISKDKIREKIAKCNNTIDNLEIAKQNENFDELIKETFDIQIQAYKFLKGNLEQLLNKEE